MHAQYTLDAYYRHAGRREDHADDEHAAVRADACRTARATTTARQRRHEPREGPRRPVGRERHAEEALRVPATTSQTDWLNTVLQDSHQAQRPGRRSWGRPPTRAIALSGNYFDQGGLIPGQGYSRGAGFASIDHSASRLHLGVSTNVSRIYQDIGEGGGAFGYAAAMQPLRRAVQLHQPRLRRPATIRVPTTISSTSTRCSRTGRSFASATTNRVFGSAFAEFQLLEGLTLSRATSVPTSRNVTEGCYNDPWTHGPCANPGANSQNQGAPPQAVPAQRVRLLVHARQPAPARPQHRQQAAHRQATALYSIQHDRVRTATRCTRRTCRTTRSSGTTSARARRAAAQPHLASGRCSRTWAASTTRCSTATRCRATGRADGSSRLAPGHKWAFFPSFGLAWQLGDEPFMQAASRRINALKLRASYGTTGNTSINPYATQGSLTPRVYSFGTALRARLSPGRDPESRPRLGEDRPDGHRPRVRACSATASRARSTGYRANTHDLLLDAGCCR